MIMATGPSRQIETGRRTGHVVLSSLALALHWERAGAGPRREERRSGITTVSEVWLSLTLRPVCNWP